jgi:hypothetical protein
LSLRKTTTVSAGAASIRSTSSANCSTLSGSSRLTGPLEKVTRQYDADTSATRNCSDLTIDFS